MTERRIKYHRRPTTAVHVGDHLIIGGGQPIVIQSMANVDTNDIEASVAQAKRIAEAGGRLVRFTTQGVREARAIGLIHDRLRESGNRIPLVADVHFNPKAAYEAAKHVEKVRINPGNFYDPARVFERVEYTDAEYAHELEELQSKFAEFLDHCRSYGTAIRIGVNHGSLSDRIMSRYGDTAPGMVESCMEFLEVCRRKGFDDVVISLKSSNAVLMTEAVRLLVSEMERRDMHYPLHLGVTEAGDAEDGRVKSAVGIGALLSEGLGDTIRVSLSEAPEQEIKPARILVECVEQSAEAEAISLDSLSVTPHPVRPSSTPLVIGDVDTYDRDCCPDLVGSDPCLMTITDREALRGEIPDLPEGGHLIVRLTHPDAPAMLRALDEVMTTPYIIGISAEGQADEAAVRLGYAVGAALLRGQGEGLYVSGPLLSGREAVRLAFGLLQASRRRISRTEFISCPGCGRTLFDLQETVARVKAATSHLKGLKIGVMGCIVNGPGEMADADYGYVGSTPGRVDLYHGKKRVRRGIPQDEAVDHLVDLIKECGDWKEKEA